MLMLTLHECEALAAWQPECRIFDRCTPCRGVLQYCFSYTTVFDATCRIRRYVLVGLHLTFSEELPTWGVPHRPYDPLYLAIAEADELVDWILLSCATDPYLRDFVSVYLVCGINDEIATRLHMRHEGREAFAAPWCPEQHWRSARGL